MKITKEERERVGHILSKLDEEYGTKHIIYLKAKDAWQLLTAVILSAQCTDKRVNAVTEKLFKKYDSPEKLSRADVSDVEGIIRECGLFHTKAKNIVLCAKKIASEYKGLVPSDIDELTKLPGVGRKTANVIRGNIYNIPSIVVDTHVKRISNKLRFTKETVPEKIERDLEKILPKENWIRYNMQIITLGRTICKSRNPECDRCFLKEYCPSASGTKKAQRTEDDSRASLKKSVERAGAAEW